MRGCKFIVLLGGASTVLMLGRWQCPVRSMPPHLYSASGVGNGLTGPVPVMPRALTRTSTNPSLIR
jgi:hypothetical protein